MDPLGRWNRLRWNQLNELEDLQRRVGSLSSGRCVHWPEHPPGAPRRIPLVTVREDARGYLLKVELPGVKQEDVKLTIEHGALIMTGDRTFELNRKKDHPAKQPCGRFAHSFEIPADARPARVSAAFKNGILAVRLAKSFCACFASRLDVSPCLTLRPNRRDLFNEREHRAKP